MKINIYLLCLLVFAFMIMVLGCNSAESPSKPSESAEPTVTETTTEIPTPAIKPWGVSTTAAAFGIIDEFGYVTYNAGLGDAMYMLNGSLQGSGGQTTVFSSTDGAAWTQITSNTPYGAKWGLNAATYQNVTWPARIIVVAGGYTQGGGIQSGDSNDVWGSGNGVDWTLLTGNAQFSDRRYPRMLEYNNKLWLIGGYGPQLDNPGISSGFNDVWNTENGADWSAVTQNANFSPRYGHAVAVFNGKMYVIGGFDGNNKADVWSSVDGITWTQETADAGFANRQQFATLVYDSKLWVLGGASTPDEAVWWTSDGSSWHSAPDVEWAARSSHGALVFDDGSGEKMWIFGGDHADTWYTEHN